MRRAAGILLGAFILLNLSLASAAQQKKRVITNDDLAPQAAAPAGDAAVPSDSRANKNAPTGKNAAHSHQAHTASDGPDSESECQ